MQCEYDGCTMVTLPPEHDTPALRTAIELTRADFCFAGDHYPLVLPLLNEELAQLSEEQRLEQTSRKTGLAPF